MKAIYRIITSGIMYGIFAVGCVGSPTTDDEPAGTAEQSLANSYKDIIYFSEPELIGPVGECITASVCSARTTVCSGTQTSFSMTTLHDCRFSPDLHRVARANVLVGRTTPFRSHRSSRRLRAAPAS